MRLINVKDLPQSLKGMTRLYKPFTSASTLEEVGSKVINALQSSIGTDRWLGHPPYIMEGTQKTYQWQEVLGWENEFKLIGLRMSVLKGGYLNICLGSRPTPPRDMCVTGERKSARKSARKVADTVTAEAAGVSGERTISRRNAGTVTAKANVPRECAPTSEPVFVMLHVLVLWLMFGTPDVGAEKLEVCRMCRHNLCVNIACMQLGTHKENMALCTGRDILTRQSAVQSIGERRLAHRETLSEAIRVWRLASQGKIADCKDVTTSATKRKQGNMS
eukprot:gene26330-17425_t